MNNTFAALDNSALLEILKQSNQAIAIYTGPEHIIQLASADVLKFWGKDESILGKKIEDALPESEKQPFVQAVKKLWATGQTYTEIDVQPSLIVEGELVNSSFDFAYKPIFDVSGKIFCILQTVSNPSERINVWKSVQEHEELENRLKEKLTFVNDQLSQTSDQLVLTEHRLQQVVHSASIGLALLKGKSMVVEIFNPEMLRIWGHQDQEVVGKALLHLLPMLDEDMLSQQLDKVFLDAQKLSFREVVYFPTNNQTGDQKYLSIDLIPILDPRGEVDSIMATVQDTTREVLFKLALKESELQFEEYNEELLATQEELQTTNNELSTLNEEYISTNEQLELYNEAVKSLNETLRERNDNLNTSNSSYHQENQELNVAKDSLQENNTQLTVLNEAITNLNNKLTDNEAGFRNLVDQAPIAILLVKGEDFIVEMINSQMLKIIGRDESIIGKPLFQEIPELLGQPATDKLIETYKDGCPRAETSSSVTMLRNGQLSEGFFNFNYAPYIENGKVTGVIDMALEVTDQVIAIQEREQTIREKSQLEQTLRSSEQRLQGILETMAEGVGIIDTSGQLVYANPMAQQILGLTLSEIQDRTYDDAQWQNLRLDGSPLPQEEHPMSIMMATQRHVYDVEIGVQPPDKDRLYISINAAPMFDEEGNLKGGIGTFMDVTSRRLITQGKDDFISIASHELKTPVTSLKASLQLLERSHNRLPGESREKLISQSIRSLESLSRLINDLLDTSRIDQGQLKLEKKSFTLDQLFENCCSHIAQTTKQKIVFQGESSQIVNADDQQIGQVLVNFISNAIKYAPQSGEIVITASFISTSEIKVSVKDSGPGIEEEKLKYLFDRYYRTDYKGQKFTGLGLGLYISAQIIKNHGGRIGVDSALGKGSEFWFTLPLADGHS
jgi:PAS domain S-box-containing protein